MYSDGPKASPSVLVIAIIGCRWRFFWFFSVLSLFCAKTGFERLSSASIWKRLGARELNDTTEILPCFALTLLPLLNDTTKDDDQQPAG